MFVIFMVRFKRGDDKYYILISLILGIIVLGLSLYFIFQEIISENGVDWEVCRQSVVLRASLPETEIKAFGLRVDSKSAYPLKCKTEVIKIERAREPEDIWEPIADAIASTWYAYGEGKFDFVSREVLSGKTACLVAARITYSDKVIEDLYENNLLMDIFIEKYGDEAMDRIPSQTRQRDFINFYNSNYVGNSDVTYESYLPIYLDGEQNKDGNLLVWWDEVDFFPDIDRNNKDYLLVYSIRLSRGWVPGFSIHGSEDLEFIDNYRTISIIPVEKLNEIGCTEFLTIPA